MAQKGWRLDLCASPAIIRLPFASLCGGAPLVSACDAGANQDPASRGHQAEGHRQKSLHVAECW